MKKYLLNFLLLASVFLWTGTSSAQLVFYFETEINWPTPGFSDGYVTVGLEGNYPNPVEFYVHGFNGVDYGTHLVVDSLLGLNEAFFNTDMYPVQMQAYDPALGIVIADSWFHAFNFPFQDVKFDCDTLESSFFSNECLGYVTAQTNVPIVGDVVVEWREMFGPYMNTDVLSPWSSLNKSSLCDGLYTTILSDALSFTQFYIGSVVDATPAFEVEVFTTPSSPSSCTGTASVDAEGAMGPMLYTWDTAALPDNTADGLCPGLYTVTVTDGNMDSLDAVYAIVDSNNYYYDPAMIYPVDDTLFFLVENCVLDYTQPIDSITIYDANFFTTSVQMAFQAWQNGTAVYFADLALLEVPATSDFLIDLTVFCPTKSIDAYLVKYNARHGSDVSTIAEENKVSLTVYPNPASGTVQVSGDQIGEIRILNLLGELILVGETGMIDISAFAPGVYMIHALDENAQQVAVQKLVVE